MTPLNFVFVVISTVLTSRHV